MLPLCILKVTADVLSETFVTNILSRSKIPQNWNSCGMNIWSWYISVLTTSTFRNYPFQFHCSDETRWDRGADSATPTVLLLCMYLSAYSSTVSRFCVWGNEALRQCWWYFTFRNISAVLIVIKETWGWSPFEKLSRRWEDNIEMDVREVGLRRGLDGSGSGYGQVAGSCDCGNGPSASIKCGEFD
jgi:hypothetical protein